MWPYFYAIKNSTPIRCASGGPGPPLRYGRFAARATFRFTPCSLRSTNTQSINTQYSKVKILSSDLSVIFFFRFQTNFSFIDACPVGNTKNQTGHKKDRAARNKVRRAALRAGRVKKGDGKDIHHKDGNPRNSSAKNLAVVSKKYNRSRNG